MEAVILAAGMGSRMGKKHVPKGLLRVGGRGIVERLVILLKKYGVSSFIVVTNQKYASIYDAFLKSLGINYKIVINPYPEKGNGYSFCLARNHVTGKFVLTMSDHVYDEGFIKLALKGEGAIVDTEGRFIDRDEATKVLVRDLKVKEIGKGLQEFTGFDTGFYILDKSIFDLCEKLVAEKEKLELSEVIGKAKPKVSFVNGLFWCDIDTLADKERAERELIKASVKYSEDGLVSRYLNRKISAGFITPLLIDRLTPNQATVLSTLIGIMAAFLSVFSLPLGGLLYQVSSILDGVDGEIARAAMRKSKFGEYMDSLFDRYVDFAFLLFLSFRLSSQLLPIVLLAVFGSVMVSYSAERYRAAFGQSILKRVSFLKAVPGKRDERIFISMLFCLVGQVELLMYVLAFLTNLRVLVTFLAVAKLHHNGGKQ